jgi:hypothetical protein
MADFSRSSDYGIMEKLGVGLASVHHFSFFGKGPGNDHGELLLYIWERY